jgi:hypothetical protein
MNSSAGKKEIEKQKSWVELICPSAVVRKRIWPVIVYGIKMENYQLDAWEKHAKSIKKENAKLTPNLKIRDMRWLKRINRKKFGPLVIEVDSAEQVNRLIIEGIVLRYDLKQVERYDAGCQII